MGGDAGKQQEILMGKILEEAKSGDMPPLQYRLLNWDAKLSKGDVQTLSMLGKSAGGSEAALAGDGDAVRGKAVFEKRCTGCHAMDVDREGPRLAGVFGRKAGGVAGVLYSDGLENMGPTVGSVAAGRGVFAHGTWGAGLNMAFIC